jgi:NMT1-like family
LPEPIGAGSAGWRGKGVLRFTLLCAAAALVAALASTFAITYDYRYLRAEFLSGVPGGQYHTLATRLSERARNANGRLTVIATEGSVENVSRLAEGHARCRATFALVQDGTPVPAAAGLVVLGKLPEPESLLLLAKRDRSFRGFDKLRQVSIGIGPENSGTAHLMRQLFDDPDLRSLNVRLSHHDLEEQGAQVAQGGLISLRWSFKRIPNFCAASFAGTISISRTLATWRAWLHATSGSASGTFPPACTILSDRHLRSTGLWHKSIRS